MTFTVVSTFAGCGGSSLGYELAGGKVLLAVEWDDNAVETYRLNHPETDIFHGDIAKLSVEEALERSGLKPGELDIFDGSPPCQGFSTAGKREFTDDRNQLFREYVRLLQGFQPKVFVMENVSGMVKGKMKLIFAEIMRTLKGCGYSVRCRLLNAKFFNIPQSRERVIFIGTRSDLDTMPIYAKPQSCEMGISIALPNVIGSRSMSINPWIKHPRAAATITKTCSDYSLMTLDGIRKPRIEELAILASFPRAYQWIGSYPQCFARIGNSVPPNFMRAIAETIRDEILAKIGV